MSRDYYQRIETIFHSALELPEQDRPAYLDDVCLGDPALRDEIDSLLSASERQESFLSESSLTLGLSLLGMESSQCLSGKRIGHYEIIQPLGRGGMGEVYLAEDPRLGRLVALKLLPPLLTQSAESILRFHQEARAASGVSHPNIAHVYEISEADGHRYIAMEYVEGCTLRVLLEQQTLEASEAVGIALQIAQALIAAHAAGITHRDIKPENIMVHVDGYVKVLDFGLAKLSEAKNKRPHQWKSLSSIETTPGLIMGTTAYMSPEQVRGHETDARTDLWSLGVVLYEMLAQRRPFTGATASDVAATILLTEPQPLTSDDADSLGLIRIVQKALSKDASNRYQTSQDFARDLQGVKQRLQVEEHTSSGAEAHPLLGVEIISLPLADERRRLPKPPDPEGHHRRGQRASNRLHWSVKLLAAMIVALPLLYVAATYLGRPSVPRAANSVSPQAGASAPARRINSIAILPFLNETGDKTLDHLSAGLTEDLTRNLSRSRTLLITAQYSAQRATDMGLSFAQIEEALGVETALRGRIKRRGALLNIHLRLIELKTDGTLWEDSFTAAPDDLLHLRDSLTAVLITHLQGLAGEDKTLPRASRLTDNNRAYRAYLEGRYLTEQAGEGNLKRAITHLEQAIALDPQFAIAHVALANAYNLLGTYYGYDPSYYQPRAKQAILRALKLDDKLPPEDKLAEAHASLAKIKMDYERDWVGAEKEFRRAIELNPGYVLAHHWYGEVYLSAMGRLDESLAELQTARRLNPLSTGILTGIAWTYIGLRRYEEAVEACRVAEEINSEDFGVYSYRAPARVKLGLFDEAISDANKAFEGGPTAHTLAALAAIYALTGRRDEGLRQLPGLKRNGPGEKVSDCDWAVIHAALASKGDEVLRRLDEIRQGKSATRACKVSNYDPAIILAAVGDAETAFELLNREVNTKSVALLSIRIDPMLDTLRADPRFALLEERLGFRS